MTHCRKWYLQLFHALKLSAERTCYPHLDSAQPDAVYSVPIFWGDERTLARSVHYMHIPAKYGDIIVLLVGGGCAVVSEDLMVQSESDSQHARVLRSDSTFVEVIPKPFSNSVSLVFGFETNSLEKSSKENTST